VVEYGYFDNRPAQLDPSSVDSLVNWPVYDMYNLTSVPQPGLLNATVRILSACVVGGGSTINGMMLTRGAADDYDNWGKLNDEPEWSFDGLLPYFRKVSAIIFMRNLLTHLRASCSKNLSRNWSTSTTLPGI
jgi:choline dehydrogenase-like flavoprotein